MTLKHLVFLELAHVQRSVQQCPKCNCFVMRIKGLKGEDSSNPAMLEAVRVFSGPVAFLFSLKNVSPASTTMILPSAMDSPILKPNYYRHGFPDSSVGKESSCNAGDPSLIPGSGRSTEEGIDYPLQYSWASLVAQLVKNPPAMWETWVRPLGWEGPLEKGKVTHSSILAWRIPQTIVHGVAKNRTIIGT